MELSLMNVKTNSEMEQVLAIRKEVFIEEQHVPENLEIDEFEESSDYILALWGEKPVGTARWRSTESGIKLERFAVLKPFRNKNVGASLVKFIVQQAGSEDDIYLFAQEQVVGFYEKYNFEVFGERFYEAGMPHFKMILIRGN